jgi:thiosulfate dehydrogenase
MTKTTLTVLVAAALALGGVVLARSGDGPPRHDAPPSASGNLVVALCDGETSAEIPGVRAGEMPTRAQAQAVVDQLMAEWRRKNPQATWDDGALAAAEVGTPEPTEQETPPPAGSDVRKEQGRREGAARGAPEAAEGERRGSTTPGEAAAGGATAGGAGGLPSGSQGEVQQGQTYGAFSERDERIWQVETDRFVREGHRVFHDAAAFGGTIGVSCDMCHPDAANTHPETYPKFQVQLGRVALLRDMINWCIQNPSRGKPLAEDDPRLKAMEAYILAQRKGTALTFGKH